MLAQQKLSKILPGRLVVSMLGVFLLLFISGCGGSSPVVTPTPTPVHITYTPLNLGLPAKALNSPVVGPLPDNTQLHVHVAFKLNQQLINKLNQQKVQTGKSQSLDKVANQLGISKATYQQIKDFFGLENAIVTINSLYTDMTIDAPAKTFAKLLQTTFVIHKLNGRTFYAPATPPLIPTFVAAVITSITGLDSYSQPPHSLLSTMAPVSHQSTSRAAANCSPDPQALTTTGIAYAYGYERFWKTGWYGQHMTINLPELGTVSTSDIQNYFACFRTVNKVTLVNVDSPATFTGSDSDLEATLDLEMAAGMAPAANIVMYQSSGNANGDPWVSMNDELQQILKDNTHNLDSGSVVSISYGVAESQITQGDALAIDHTLQLLTQVEHMTVFVSSGDCGAFADRTFGDLGVSYPASSIYATAVGGTELAINPNTGARVQEIAWSDGSNTAQCTNQWGTGGGNSAAFKQPGYQVAPGVNNQSSTGMREVPDISAVAFGIAMYFNSQWQIVGGTSAASPIWAAGMALVNQGTLQLAHTFFVGTGLFYAVDTSNTGNLHPFNDITQGDNLFYKAGRGWNYPTGLGSPNLVDFFRFLLKVALTK
jgi:kumamolisin